MICGVSSLYHTLQNVALDSARNLMSCWDVVPCRSCVNRRFGGTYRLHLQCRKISLQLPARAGFLLVDFCTLKMEAISCSETSVHTRSTRHYIPENGILSSHRCVKLRYYLCLAVNATSVHPCVHTHLPSSEPEHLTASFCTEFAFNLGSNCHFTKRIV
jgi:hypothetical protein